MGEKIASEWKLDTVAVSYYRVSEIQKKKIYFYSCLVKRNKFGKGEQKLLHVM